FRGIEGLEPGGFDKFLPLLVTETPDVTTALQVVVHPAEICRRLAIRDQPPARADDERDVFDAHRALVLAGAAGRALPQHFLAVDFSELPVAWPRFERVLRLQYQRFGIQFLAG